MKSNDPLAHLAEQQDWITPAAQQAAQSLITNTIQRVGGPGLQRLLHGDWLHEPLHAVLTDIPIGAWTATVAFDALGTLFDDARLDTAADATLYLGLLGAAGAAVTGLNDWSTIEATAARRVGAVHGLLNVLATGLFAGSCLARRRKSRNSGKALTALGYLAVIASAHLGGNLVYEHGIGMSSPQASPQQV